MSAASFPLQGPFSINLAQCSAPSPFSSKTSAKTCLFGNGMSQRIWCFCFIRPFFSVRGGFVFNISFDNICSHQIRSYSTAKRGGSRCHIEDSMAKDVPHHSFLNVWASFGPKIQTGFRTFLLKGLIWSEFGGGMTAGFDGIFIYLKYVQS